MRKFLFILTLIFSVAAHAQQQYRAVDNSVLSAFTDSTNYLVGSTVNLIVEHRIGVENYFLDTAQGLALLGEEVDTIGERLRRTTSFLVLDSGRITMPLASLDYTGDSYTTEPLVINAMIIPQQDGVDRAPYRDLTGIEFNIWHWLDHFKWYILGGLGFIALLLALRKMVKRLAKPGDQEELIPEKDWFSDTMKELQALRKEQPWEVDAKAYYVRIGDILRRYLGVQTGLPISEQTTSESLNLLRNKWTSSQLQSFEFIMTRADFVKFAKGQMTVQDHLDCLRRAEQLVLDFKPKEQGDGVE
jgi:hypothetical protein